MLGTTLGVYQILEKLGEGGMGVVYRARDTRLGRDVALKVLPAAFANDPQRMARFEREAHVLASLNHANIATLYGVEESGGVRALVMELVEGPTLAERIAAGPLPLEEALPLARQMTDALELAHEKGVTHRDLKPANIKVTPQGAVKLLDFGLAKALDDEPGASGGPHSPTLSLAATRAGMILGTAAYMSPEQARGTPVDQRADIWSFGVVLYEMLVAKQLFGGEMVSDSLAAVITKEPDWEALPADTPAVIRQLLVRCLRKPLRSRLQAIGEARIAIEEHLAAVPSSPHPPISSSQPLTPVAPSPSRVVPYLGWLLAAALLVVAAVLGLVHFRETSPERPVVRFVIPAPEKGSFRGLAPVISPDGRRVAFITSAADGQFALWVRPIDSLEAQRLPGTEGAAYPFWSPDSRFIGFNAGAKLKKIEASGGPSQTLCDSPTFASGAWSRNGVIVFGSFLVGALLQRVSAAGGTTALLTTLDSFRQEVSHSQPHFLPDGRHFLYFVRSGQTEHSGVYLSALDSKDRKRLLGTESSAAYSPPRQGNLGHLLFLRDGTLMAQSLDAVKLELAGDPFPVAEQVGSAFGVSFFSVSANGVLAYRTGGGQQSQPSWFDREGKPLGTAGAPGNYITVALSPDGTQVALARTDPQANNTDLWLHDLRRGIPSRFTFHPSNDQHPIWSPDGSRIVYASGRDGPFNLYQKVSSGSGSEEALLQSGESKRPHDWSRDGRFIVYSSEGPKAGSDLWVLPVRPAGADRKPMPYLKTEFSESHAQFSPGPDGAPGGAPRWMAYASNESGRTQVYVQPFPASGGKSQISSEGGYQPRWRRDGKELFFIAPDARLMSVEVKAAPKFEATVPKALFQTRIFAVSAQFAHYYDVAPDGRRFLINSQLQETASAPITVVMNWREGLKK